MVTGNVVHCHEWLIKFPRVPKTLTIYHLHDETRSSMMCANDKQKSLMVSSFQIGHLLYSNKKKNK